MRLYINGVQSATTSVGFDFTVSDQSTDFSIGRVGEYNGLYFNGNISDFRFVKGTCVYTSGTTFTPPTAPLTAITNTSLLVNGTDAGIIDKSQSAKTISLNGGAKSSTAQTKYLTSSMYFDGSDDYLQALSLSGNFLTASAWTQEMWIRLASTSAGQQIGPAFGGGVKLEQLEWSSLDCLHARLWLFSPVLRHQWWRQYDNHCFERSFYCEHLASLGDFMGRDNLTVLPRWDVRGYNHILHS